MDETDIDEAFADDTWDGATSDDEDGSARHMAKRHEPHTPNKLDRAEHELGEKREDPFAKVDLGGWDGATSLGEDGTDRES